jgi:hypothetical protein
MPQGHLLPVRGDNRGSAVGNASEAALELRSALLESGGTDSRAADLMVPLVDGEV